MSADENSRHKLRQTFRFFLEIIGLQTPRGRLVFFGLVALFGLIINHDRLQYLPSFSLYSRLGIPSPSIGLTRAFLHITEGNFAAAYDQNFLIYPVLAVVAYIIIRDIWSVAK